MPRFRWPAAAAAATGCATQCAENRTSGFFAGPKEPCLFTPATADRTRDFCLAKYDGAYQTPQMGW